MDIKTVQKVHELKRDLEVATSQYYHSRPLVSSDPQIILEDSSCRSFTVHYGLKDFLLIGAITENPVLLTGGTDLGKTTLARMAMTGLFGKEEVGWHRLDFDLDFGKDSYTNVNSDFFHESGKTLDDLYSLHNWMKLPGFIADELNGAHPKIARKALHIIREKDITLSNGRRVKIGYPIPGTEDTYQYQIATINEGKDYSGTFDMDKALRRRTTIEIPMDIFSPTPFDRLCIHKIKGTEAPLEQSTSQIPKILDILHSSRMALHPSAEIFIAYLESFDYCKNSFTGEKGSIESRNGCIAHVCTQPVVITQGPSSADMACHFLRSFVNDMCPNIRGITPGVSENLVSVAKGIALLRAVKFIEMVSGSLQGVQHQILGFEAFDNPETVLQRYTQTTMTGQDLARKAIEKYVTNLEIEQPDILAAVGFVGYSKIGINPTWVAKFYQGNRFEAVKNFCAEAQNKFMEGLGRAEMANLSKVLSGEATDTAKNELISHLTDENPWMLRALTPYFIKQETVNKAKAFDLYV
jgi:hypothetical protein